MSRYRIVFLLVIGVCTMFSSCAQQGKPFYEDIQAFKQADKQNPPPKNAIVFVGSSSFTKWTDVQDYFPSYPIINRGFGGSTLRDAIEYADDIVTPYQPRQVVVYSGENDVAGGDVSADTVAQRFITFFKKVRAKLPDVNIVYISMKPSPSRKQFMPIVKEGNEKIKGFLSREKNTAFVDVYVLMLDSAGNPRPELFIEDMLHMKKEGYEIWQKAIERVLLK